MKTIHFMSTAVAAVVSLSALALATPASAAEVSAGAVRVLGEKQDSGLGSLPHYGQWADPTGKAVVRQASSAPAAPVRVAGEKQDSGLGDLPHYRYWTKPTQVSDSQAVRVSSSN